MKKINKNLLIAIISIFIFMLFIISFFALSSMVRNGIVNNIEFSQAMEGTLAFIIFIPLLVSLFFFGKHLETKKIFSLAKIMKYMSIGLLAFSIIQILLSLIGFYD